VLLAGIQRHKGLSQATLEAAEHVEQVTQKVEAALVPLKTLREELRAARRMCDVLRPNPPRSPFFKGGGRMDRRLGLQRPEQVS
jgi:hypothetical protein